MSLQANSAFAGATLEPGRVPNGGPVMGVFLNDSEYGNATALAHQRANSLEWAKQSLAMGDRKKATVYAKQAGVSIDALEDSQRVGNGGKYLMRYRNDGEYTVQEQMALAGTKFPTGPVMIVSQPMQSAKTIGGAILETGIGFALTGAASSLFMNKGRAKLYNWVAGGENVKPADRLPRIEIAARAQAWASTFGGIGVIAGTWIVPRLLNQNVFERREAPHTASGYVASAIMESRDTVSAGAAFRIGRDWANVWVSRNPSHSFHAAIRQVLSLDPSYTAKSFDKDGKRLATAQVDFEGGLFALRGLKYNDKMLAEPLAKFSKADVKNDGKGNFWVEKDGKRIATTERGHELPAAVAGGVAGFLSGAVGNPGEVEWHPDVAVPPPVPIPAAALRMQPAQPQLQQPSPVAYPQASAPTGQRRLMTF